MLELHNVTFTTIVFLNHIQILQICVWDQGKSSLKLLWCPHLDWYISFFGRKCCFSLTGAVFHISGWSTVRVIMKHVWRITAFQHGGITRSVLQRSFMCNTPADCCLRLSFLPLPPSCPPLVLSIFISLSLSFSVSLTFLSFRSSPPQLCSSPFLRDLGLMCRQSKIRARE